MAGSEKYNGFSETYLEKVLHEESETEGWSLYSRSQFAEVWRKKYLNESLHVIKGFLHFPGVPADDVVEMIHDFDLRKRWDTQFSVINVLKEHQSHRVVYWLTHLPLGMSTRDIVQYMAEKRDLDTNTTYILYSHVPEDVVATKPGIVRAVSIQSATIIRPDPDDPGSTRVTILFQTNLGGRIPNFLVNLCSPLAPPKWRKDLYNFYISVYSKEKQSRDMLEAKSLKGTEDCKTCSQKQTALVPA